jgi:hypothetical protein
LKRSLLSRRSRSHLSAPLLAGLCALAVFASGCTDSGAAETGAGQTAITASAEDNAPPILNQMEGVLDSTAFRGVRRVFQRQGNGSLEQLEDVGADGTGQFSIELSDVVTYPPDVDSHAYDILFESSARFQWTMRDFQVRNAAQVAGNYLVTPQSVSPTVAGISCVRIGFLRNDSVGGRPGHYEADVDPSTGFVLAWREFDDVGTILAEVTYESFAYNGDVSDMTLRGRSFTVRPLSLALDLGPQVGFTTRLPDLLPGRMEFTVAEIQTVPGSMAAGLSPGSASFLPVGDWLRLVATDGLEAMVFTHASRTLGVTPSAAAMGELKMYQVGTWEIGFGRLDATAFVVAARASMDEIRLIVGSAF